MKLGGNNLNVNKHRGYEPPNFPGDLLIFEKFLDISLLVKKNLLIVL